MEIKIGSKNMELPERARAYIERKLEKFARRSDDIKGIKVEVSSEKTRAQKDRFIVRVVLDCNTTLLHTEERGTTIQSAVDKAIPVTERQFEKWRGKVKDRTREISGAAESMPEEAQTRETISDRPSIVKVKRFAIKPMPVEEAADQMEILKHDFFLFTDAQTNTVNLLYRRRDGNYGLITSEPE